MALHPSRTCVLACTIPAAIVVAAAYIWVKKKKKKTKIYRTNTKSVKAQSDCCRKAENNSVNVSNFDQQVGTETNPNCVSPPTSHSSPSRICKLNLNDNETLKVSEISDFDYSTVVGTLTEIENKDFEENVDFDVSCSSSSGSLTMATTIPPLSPAVPNLSNYLNVSVDVSSTEKDDDETVVNSSTITATMDLTCSSDDFCSQCNNSSVFSESFSQTRLNDTTESSFHDSSSQISLSLDDSFVKVGESGSFNGKVEEMGITNSCEDLSIDNNESNITPDEAQVTEQTPPVDCTDLADTKRVVDVVGLDLEESFTQQCVVDENMVEISEIVEESVCEEVKKEATENDEQIQPPAAVSPSLSTEEPELQKLTNGNETSAYCSANHSPAEELLQSPTARSDYSDHNEWNQSEGSSDSGKGGSDVNAPAGAQNDVADVQSLEAKVYEFEIPPQLCGRMIGYKGQHVRSIKAQTRADISIYGHPYNSNFKICSVMGSDNAISAALELIRKRFPLAKFPDLTLIQINTSLLATCPGPETLQLHLPHSVTCDVILSSLMSAGHFFVQQPTHPTYPSLSRLDHFMLNCYSEPGAPSLPTHNASGVICAAQTMGGWYRAQVGYVFSDINECDVRFLDYGGYARESLSNLRQIRSDFMTLPFQASECYLANVAPLDDAGWTVEANSYFEELAQGQILQAQIVTYSEDEVPYVQLYRVQGASTTFINAELVNGGFARWVEHQS